MKKLIFGFVAVILFMSGFMVANLVGFKNIAEAAGEIWKKIDLNVFNQDLITKVGIGTKTPSEKLSVVGKIESTDGGFKFPDGTVQVTAGDKNLHLYDANGYDFGVLIRSAYSGDDITYDVLDKDLNLFLGFGEAGPNKNLELSDGGIMSRHFSSGDNVYFTGDSCTGTPFFDIAFNKYELVRPLGINRYFVYKDFPKNFNSKSYMTNLSGGGCQILNSSFNDVYELREISLPFVEPLAFPLVIK